MMLSACFTGKISALFTLMLLAMIACGPATTKDHEQLLAGDESKTWRTDQPFAAAEEGRALTQAQEDEQIQFNTDGSLRIIGDTETRSGTWTYRSTERMLELSFEDQPAIVETYYITRLEEERLLLRSQDGGTMRLRAVNAANE